VYDFRVPIEIGAVRIRPGDILFGDIDGVLVVPAEAEPEVFNRALEKACTEQTVKRDLENGLSAGEAFARHGVM
jgi:4-hydroxy-4-methyl-2-oxoglutarate aldolase